MSYSINNHTNEVTRLSDGKIVAPCQSADDPDFVAYVDWVNAGNQPTVVDPPVVPVIVVSPVQIRLALNRLGLRDALETMLAGNRDYKDIFEFSLAIHSNHPMVSAFASAIGKTDADIQQLFELAASIEV